jgi:hypothetical protein
VNEKTSKVRAAVYQLATGEQFVVGYRPSPDAEWVTTCEEVTFEGLGYFYPEDRVPCAIIEAEVRRGVPTYPARVVEDQP